MPCYRSAWAMQITRGVMRSCMFLWVKLAIWCSLSDCVCSVCLATIFNSNLDWSYTKYLIYTLHPIAPVWAQRIHISLWDLYGGCNTRRYTLVHCFCFFKLFPIGCILLQMILSINAFVVLRVYGKWTFSSVTLPPGVVLVQLMLCLCSSRSIGECLCH